MPFSLEWSNDVHQALAAACKAMSVTPVRGDDVFTPTDILVDIWQSINGSGFRHRRHHRQEPERSLRARRRAHTGKAGADHFPACRRHSDRPQHQAHHSLRSIRGRLARRPRDEGHQGDYGDSAYVWLECDSAGAGGTGFPVSSHGFRLSRKPRRQRLRVALQRVNATAALCVWPPGPIALTAARY